MKAYESAFPYTDQLGPYDIVGPLTARLGTSRNSSSLPQIITGASNVVVDPATGVTPVPAPASGNPFSMFLQNYLGIENAGIRLLLIIVGILLLVVAAFRIIK